MALLSVTLDETAGLQNDATSNVVGDLDDNDINVGSLPADFTTALTAFGTPTIGAALSGYDGTNANTTETNVFTFGANVLDVAFTDIDGDPLVGVYSGLTTLDGSKIYLYTATDNNVLLGRTGELLGSNYVADPDGALVFAAYLDTGTAAAGDAGATAAKVWLVQYEPLYNLDSTNPDDPVSPLDVIHVTVSQLGDIPSLEGAPSGSNLFLMFGTPGDGNASNGDEVAIIVTGKLPADQSSGANISTGDTVITSKGGGNTTIGTNNQMVDPGEGLYFTFVTDADPDYTVAKTEPRLTQTEANIEANIKFGDVFGATGATFDVVQLQPPKEATLKISAYTTEAETGVNFVNGLGDDDDQAVAINYVKVTTFTKVGKTLVTNAYEFTADGTQAGITVTFVDGPVAGSNDITVTISGLEATDRIEYHTAGVHNRVLIDNVGNTLDPNLNSSFDIGGFSLTNANTTTQLYDGLVFEDDGPTATGTAVSDAVDEDGLAGGIAGGVGDVAGELASASGSIASIFQSGVDEPLTYGLSLDTSGLLQTLTSQGGAVLYAVSGNTLTAYVEVGGGDGYQGGTDRPVFTFAITNTTTGAYTFTLLDQLDHPTLNGLAGDDTENDITLNLGSILQATDKDGDTVTAAAEKLVMTVDDDTPTVATSPVQDTTPTLGATQWTYSEAFAYSIGADQHGPTYSATDSDFAELLLSGFANDVAISSPSVTWDSEDDSLATFDLSFNYDHDHNGTATEPVTGQLVFDKINDTYTVTLDALQVSQDVTLGQGTGYETYDIGGTTPSSGPSPVATGKLGEGFYLQITGFESPLSAGGNTVVDNGELVSGTVAPVTLSSTALGVSGNTIQSGEAAKLGFFTTDPQGDLTNEDFAYATDFFIKFDGIETESDDLILVLDLVDASNPAVTTTRAIYVDQGDIYEKDTNNAGLVGTKYESIVSTLDNNDGLLIVESNDYNINVGDQWVLRGLEILSNDAGLTGSAINLNRAVGSSGGSSTAAVSVSGLIGPGNTIAEDTSTNPLKIIDAGFSTTTTTQPTLDLELNFKVVDADGDYTAEQTIDIEFTAQQVALVGISSLETVGLT